MNPVARGPLDLAFLRHDQQRAPEPHGRPRRPARASPAEKPGVHSATFMEHPLPTRGSWKRDTAWSDHIRFHARHFCKMRAGILGCHKERSKESSPKLEASLGLSPGPSSELLCDLLHVAQPL